MAAEVATLFEQAAASRHAGQRLALATVIKTWGSSPRPPGSQLLMSFDAAGGTDQDQTPALVGSVSGGCIEGAVITAAAEILDDPEKKPRLLEFGVTHDMAWSVGLSCGGTVQVFVEALSDATLALFATIHERLAERQASALVTDLATGEKRLGTAEDAADANSPVAQAIASERAQIIDAESGPGRFVQPFCPSPRLIVVGAVHIAQALCQLAAIAGFDVAIIDPRTTFATLERFPGVQLYPVWPAEALAELGIDARTAVVTLTHDPKLDDPALQAALRSPAFYVGSLGSGKTHAARLNRLRSRGFEDADLGRIHGPVGLRIGARSPSEIAVSILAQLVSVLRGSDKEKD